MLNLQPFTNNSFHLLQWNAVT